MKDVKLAKQELRERVWKLMEEKGVSKFPPPRGRIPNFAGAELAAKKLSDLEEWKVSSTVFVSPDSPQAKVREIALEEGKTLIMATPRLKRGFVLLDGKRLRNPKLVRFASTIRGAMKLGKFFTLEEDFSKPSLIVIGCVAVDPKNGYRLGKGGGYGDREVAILTRKFGRIKVATTVHEIQLVDGVPAEKHDSKVDIIVTPERVIRISE